MALNHEQIAQEMAEAHSAHQQIEPFTRRFPALDTAAAYQIADRLHHQRIASGEKMVGRKIGFTNAALWERYGVTAPIWAPMYESTVLYLPDAQGEFSIGHLCEPKIEPEIIFHFAETPTVGASRSELLTCIDWVALGYEIVQCHFPGWQFQAPDVIVDAGLHAALLMGEPRPVSSLGGQLEADLQHCHLALSSDGALQEEGVGANVLGHPLQAISYLLSVLDNDGMPPPQAGEIITTGTITQVPAIAAGQRWTTVTRGIALPDLDVLFTARMSMNTRNSIIRQAATAE